MQLITVESTLFWVTLDLEYRQCPLLDEFGVNHGKLVDECQALSNGIPDEEPMRKPTYAEVLKRNL